MNSWQQSRRIAVVLLCVVPFASCRKRSAPPPIQLSLPQPTPFRPFEDGYYRTIDDKQRITLLSAHELELRDQGTRLRGRYTKKDGVLRIVVTIMGNTQTFECKITDQGIRANDGSTLLSPEQWVFLHDLQTHNYDQAVIHASEALRLHPKDPYLHNNYAYLLATCPKASIRDGKKAVEHATIACSLTDYKYPLFIDSLAAAYAETGDFEQAVQWQEKYLAFPAVTKDAYTRGVQKRETYKAANPFHEKQ